MYMQGAQIQRRIGQIHLENSKSWIQNIRKLLPLCRKENLCNHSQFNSFQITAYAEILLLEKVGNYIRVHKWVDEPRNIF